MCIERELDYQFHEVEDKDMVAAYVTDATLHEISTVTAFFLGAAWMLEQEKEQMKQDGQVEFNTSA